MTTRRCCVSRERAFLSTLSTLSTRRCCVSRERALARVHSRSTLGGSGTTAATGTTGLCNCVLVRCSAFAHSVAPVAERGTWPMPLRRLGRRAAACGAGKCALVCRTACRRTGGGWMVAMWQRSPTAPSLFSPRPTAAEPSRGASSAPTVRTGRPLAFFPLRVACRMVEQADHNSLFSPCRETPMDGSAVCRCCQFHGWQRCQCRVMLGEGVAE
jgi:hypothetical protein